MGALGVVAILGLAGCSTDRDPDELFGPSEAGAPVLDAVLIVDAELPDVFLTVAAPPGEPLDLSTVGLEADVMQIEIENGPTILYTVVPGSAGQYVPSTPGVIVEPETTYRFFARAADGREVRAETTTPPRYSVDRWIVLEEDAATVRQTFTSFAEADDDSSVYFLPENQTIYASGLLEAQFAVQPTAAVQVGIFSLDLDSDFVIDPDFFEDEDFDELERVQSSPPLDAQDGSVRLPWFAIFFAGRHKIKLYSIDDNWYDLVRTESEFGGGAGGFGGSAGDSFERPIFNVEGGIGLFGSAAVDSVGFFVNPRP